MAHVRVASFAAALALLAPAVSLAADSSDAPALSVVKLKPDADAAQAAAATPAVESDADKEVDGLLGQISAKKTDDVDEATWQAEKKAQFDHLVALDDAAVPRLSLVLHDGNARFDQRWVAARALGKIGGTTAVKSLRSALSDDKFSMVRLAAIEGLKDLNDPGAYDLLVKGLTDDALVVRSAAADALGALGDARAVDPLTAALDREDNFYKGHSLWVRRHIVAALGQLQSRAAVKTLIHALDDHDPMVTREAISSLELCTKVTFKVPANTDAELVSKATPKWKSWWESNKKDYL